MYCTNCGNEIQPGAKFCPSCGKEAINAEAEALSNESAAAAETPISQPIPPKSLKFKLLVVIISVLVLLAAAAAWAAISTGIFLNPKQYYALVEQRNTLRNLEDIKDAFKDSINKYEALAKDKPSSLDARLQLTIDKKDIPEEAVKAIDFLNALKVHYSVVSNPAGLQSAQDIGLSVQETELANLKLYWDKTKIYAQAPVLLDKYFMLDLENIKATAENLGLDSGALPENISEEDIRKALGMESEEEKEDKLGPILKKYGQLYFESIPEECIKLERGSSLEMEGRKLKCSKLSLNFDEEQLKDFILVFTGALKDDEELYKMLSENMQESEKLLKNYNSLAGINLDDKFEKSDYKDMIRNFEGLVRTDLSVPDGASMTLWVNNGKIVKRTVDTIIGSEAESVGISTETSGIKASDGKYRTYAAIDLTDESGGSNSRIGLIFKESSYYDGSKKADVAKGEVEFTAKVSQAAQYKVGFDWDTEVKNSSGVKTTSTQYNLQYRDSSFAANDFRIYGDVIHSMSEKSKQKTLNDDLSISAYFMPGGEAQGKRYGGKLQLVTERAYDTDFKLPEFAADKVVDLSRTSSSELYELGIEAGKSIAAHLEKNPKLNDFGDFNSIADMLQGNILKQPVRVPPTEGDESTGDAVYRIEEFNTTYTLNSDGGLSYTDSGGNPVQTAIMPDDGDYIQKLYYGTYKGRLVFVFEKGDFESSVSCLVTVDRNLKTKPWEGQFFGGFNTGDSLIDGNLIYLNSFGFVGAVNLDNGQFVWNRDDLAAKYDANSLTLLPSDGETLEYQVSTNTFENLNMSFNKKSGELISVTDNSGRSISEPTVTKIGFARSLDPVTYQPEEVVTGFTTEDTVLYYVIRLDEMPPGVDIEYIWKYNGTQFDRNTSYLQERTSGQYFQTNYMLGGYGSYPPGTYTVQLVGTKYGTELFRVEESIELTMGGSPL